MTASTLTFPQNGKVVNVPAGPGSFVLGRKLAAKWVQADVLVTVDPADQVNSALNIFFKLEFSPDDGVTWTDGGSGIYRGGNLIPVGVPGPGIYNVDLFINGGQDVRISWDATVGFRGMLTINLRDAANKV